MKSLSIKASALLAVLLTFQCAFGDDNYDPNPPDNPGANSWDPETGSMLVDDFTPGSLRYAIFNLLGTRFDYPLIKCLTVIGEVASKDYECLSSYEQLVELDFSRTYGVAKISGHTFDDSVLESVKLPEDVTEIWSYAFNNCSQLRQLSVYALDPPKVYSKTFYNVPADMVVFVPEPSVNAYKEADVWKDFDIQPIPGWEGIASVSMKDGIQIRGSLREGMLWVTAPEQKVLDIVLYDLLGIRHQLAFRASASGVNGMVSASLPSLRPGIYVATVTTDRSTILQKLCLR